MVGREKAMKEAWLRKIPSVDSLLIGEKAALLIGRFGREAFLKECRSLLDEMRHAALEDRVPSEEAESLDHESILLRIEARLSERFSPALQKAVNATGILMHSGLGRAVLSEDARKALDEVSRGYCTLALDLEMGRRTQRDTHIGRLLRELTGAEAAMIVNNNAAATVLILHALARGREVIVSRGQLVEIGGSFRMPAVMKTSGALLREVGTTNKTHLGDYDEAINENTAAILRVHHSNYRILGFAEEPEIEELVELGRKRRVPVIDDLGSGALVDLKEFGLETEPLVRRSISAGVSAACFSGDKLIGGPQAGIIVGKADDIGRIRKDSLSRAFRCGKLTLAAMEATLKLFLSPETLRLRHPFYRMLSLDLAEIQRRARRVERSLKKRLPAGADISVIGGASQVGSGSVPVETIPTKCLALKPTSLEPEEMAKRLRLGRPPVFTRIHKDAILFDFRTILPDEDRIVEESILKVFPHD
jgi:L-seryl-tRNA(Ser) seleniumtransferase